MDTAGLEQVCCTDGVRVHAGMDMHVGQTEKKDVKAMWDSFERSEGSDEWYALMANCYDKMGRYAETAGASMEMPSVVFGDRFGWDMQHDIASHMDDYYKGNLDEGGLRDYFMECCENMRRHQVKQFHTNGNTEADNRRIVSAVYEIFAKENVRAANHANYNEGAAINEGYGSGSDWAYYNADYYYKWEETRGMLQDFTASMEEAWGLSRIDTDEVEKNSVYTLDGGMDFNSVWNFHFRNQAGSGNIEDASFAPPERFNFFFKEAPKDAPQWTGILSLTLDGNDFKMYVPFDYNSYRTEIFDLDELFEKRFPNDKVHKKYTDFLKNITVFSRVYASNTGIWNVAGNYRPRR